MTRFWTKLFLWIDTAEVLSLTPAPDGWWQWGDRLPPDKVLIQIKYDDGEHEPMIGVIYPEELAENNLDRACLSWRLTGIGRRQLETRGHSDGIYTRDC